jgi:hypothetical protein
VAEQIGSDVLAKGLTSDTVRGVLHSQLEALGFQVEKGKVREQKIERPVFFRRTVFLRCGIRSMPTTQVGDVGWRSRLEERGWGTRSTAISFRRS